MGETTVKVENLGKKYIIGHQGRDTARFNEFLTGLGKNIIKRLKNPLKPYDVSLELEDFWAVRNVSFELKKGDRLGIIGHNGSGKSTTLKMLSRITTPTEGRITMVGRVASLLEVGTGFHPELTGRENIYLNGSILGMKRSEIRAKFDEIVDFSGVEKFLDTPVKRYSSGMYVRLAFSVAAHLNPEILVVDEVLSVGDSEFQRKCIGKMQDISSDSGKTILFVSHNLRAVQLLCNKGLLLNHGKMIHFGDIGETTSKYIAGWEKFTSIPLKDRTDRNGTGKLKFVSCQTKAADGKPISFVPMGQPFDLELELESQDDYSKEIHMEIQIFSSSDIKVGSLNFQNLGIVPHLHKGLNKILFHFPKNPFYPNQYTVNLYSSINEDTTDYITNAAIIKTIDGSFQDPNTVSQAFQCPVAFDYSVTVNDR